MYYYHHHNQAGSVLIKDLLLGRAAGTLNSSVTDILRECGSNLGSLHLIYFIPFKLPFYITICLSVSHKCNFFCLFVRLGCLCLCVYILT